MYIFVLFQGYIPPNTDRRKLTLERKRQEYYNFIDQYYETRHQELHQETFRQVKYAILYKNEEAKQQRHISNKLH